MKAGRSAVPIVLCLLSTAACHRYETVNDLKAAVGTRGRLTLSPEGRGANASRLGGVAMEVTGVLVEASGDSLAIKADEVRFSDLGTVPFAQGELRFPARDIASVSREVLNRKKTTIMSIAVAVGAILAAAAFSPGSGFLGFGRNDPPTPR